MGYMRHHAIVVTTYDLGLAEKALKEARELGCTTSELVKSPVNGYASFLIAPDGSKEGWSQSTEGDDQRSMFKQWLHQQAYDDDSSSYDWAEVVYGDENGELSITGGR